MTTDSPPLSGLHERVLSTVGPALASGEVPAGTVLTIDGIVIEHQVSRTVARDVVKVLESLHLVTARPRVGLTVRPSSEWNVLDPRLIRWRLAGPDRAAVLRSLHEMRHGVEPRAAALAAERATPEHCGRLTAAAIGMAVTGRQGDLTAYLEHDVAFHRALLEASGNELFAALASIVGEVLAGRTHHDLMPARPEPSAVRLHADVAQAVASGDAAGAEQGMREIVGEAQRAVDSAFPTC
ncbi:FCD domain-containing protein [Actinotalea sp. K2]|uniref:FadR/GntR family transcriptional regulator n=1 Tax=Actinotalea sp. K2 TaxID=2939438 RepID=UPI002017AA63|nr:FCD domain-containing protein [Actinotalea sp. K2]MCL3863147.1 FCD domain-containing protein [Actinotalea sp. K2]